MFKNAFSKYLLSFVLIITVSFILLSGIITTMIKTELYEDKINKLAMSSSIIADEFESERVENLEVYISAGVASNIITLIPIVNLDYDFNVLITNAEGKILLSTIEKMPDGSPSTHGKLGSLDLGRFERITTEDGEEFLTYEGEFEKIDEGTVVVRGKEVFTGGKTRGYVFTLADGGNDDRLIAVSRKAVINSSVWVMIAAVIATYFITERMVHPLRMMTRATKKFAKGDFSERITVSGADEIATLATAFNNMADSLDSLEKMRNSFLSSVSHDLRTPMTTISGFIDGIISGAIPEEKHEYYLGVVSSEVQRLSRLVSQLLDLSRLESGDRKFSFTDFDVAELTRLVLISFEKKIDDKRLDVIFDAECDTMAVKADKDAIHQVVYNLIHNATKFSVEGGRFEIKINSAEGGRVRVSVFDEGQLLTDEDAKHIFDRFYKSDQSRGLDKSGVGLGLYICKTIIEAHGENIGVERRDNGCEFFFTLKAGDNGKLRK